ncbi:hypothetical protein [Nostoc linckia]|uniref:hypothetical protein n=1 Tax=Nostoc linckia TaxID=92942 RepID=UPI0015D4DBA2|nr:hypothetical protein [Nostoc linckia]
MLLDGAIAPILLCERLRQRLRSVQVPNAQCPMPHAQCPMPPAPYPMPNAPYPLPYLAAKWLNLS